MRKLALVFLIFSFLPLLCSSPCTDVVEPKSFADCEQFNNEEDETICCLVTRDVVGNENQKRYSCFDMDIIFEGKEMDFKNSVLSGRLNCKSTSKAVLLIPNFFLLYIYISFIGIL